MPINPASKTVRSLSIVVIVLSVLGIIGVLMLSAMAVGGMAVYNSDEVQSELAKSTWEDVIGNNTHITMTEQERGELAQAVGALESLDNSQVEPLTQLIKGLSEGDASALRTLLVESDTTEVTKLIGAVGSLSDSDIEKLSQEVSGVSVSDLKRLRDAANSVTSQDIASLQALISETSPRDAANSIMGMVAGIGTGALVFALIAVILSLVAGILGLRNAFEPQRLGSAFAVSIIAAILALFTGRIVSMILHIVASVYISKARNTQIPTAPAYPSAPGYPPATM